MTRRLRLLLAGLLATPALALAATVPVAFAETTADGAEFTVPDEAQLGGTLSLRGSGWTTSDGSAGSIVIVKFDVRTSGDVPVRTTRAVRHPATGVTLSDKTIQAAVQADADGDWSLEVPMPTPANSDADWAAGEVHHVRLLSGSMKSGDTPRSGGADITVTAAAGGCSPTSATATVDVAATVSFGGRLAITGTGWCHPSDGASRVAVKIDEGAYSRLDDDVHTNRTIWTIIDPDPATGSFSATLTIPDGTAATSEPALASGAHTLRLLTGSLKDGDQVRSVLSPEFVIGDYRPNGAPDPLDPTRLTAGARKGVTLERSARRVEVTVPGAGAGDWVFLDVYADNAPRGLWGTRWFTAGAGGVVTAPLTGVTLPTGRSKLVAISGEQGEVGTLLGWAPLRVAGTGDADGSDPDDDTGGSGNDGGNSGSGTGGAGTGSTGSTGGTGGTGGTVTPSPIGPPVPGAAAAPPAGATPPGSTPEAPVDTIDDLDSDNARDVAGVVTDGRMSTTLPDADEGDWVFVWLYTGDARAALGWTQVGAEGVVDVDVSALGDARFKLAFLAEDGTLIGWSGAGIDAASSTSAASSTGRVVSVAPAAADTPSPLLLNIALAALGVLSLIGTTAALFVGRPRAGKA